MVTARLREWIDPDVSRAAERAAVEHREALEAEIAELSEGDAEAVAGALEALEAERIEARDRVITLRALYRSSPSAHGGEYREAHARAADLANVMIPAVRRRLAALRADEAERKAREWNAATGTRATFNAYLAQRAEQLAPLAQLVAAHESARLSGAGWERMLPLPLTEDLDVFVRYVQHLARCGFKPSMKSWPPSVAEAVKGAEG